MITPGTFVVTIGDEGIPARGEGVALRGGVAIVVVNPFGVAIPPGVPATCHPSGRILNWRA